MSTTLTREILLAKVKGKQETVSVEGFGDVLFRTVGEVLACRRGSQHFDDSGHRIEKHFERRRIYQLIDQVCNADGTPMFTGEDADMLVESIGNSDALDPLIAAMNEFNGDEDSKKKIDDTSDSAESLNATSD